MAFELVLAALVIAMFATPGYASHPDCDWGGSSLPSSTSRYDRAGNSFNGNKGIATDMSIYQPYLEYNTPTLGVSWNLQMIYLASGNGTPLGDYYELGWQIERFASGSYSPPHIVIARNGASVWDDYSDDFDIDIPLSLNTTRRFKMYVDTAPNPDVIRFQVGYPGGVNYTTIPYTPGTPQSWKDQSNYLHARSTHEVFNTCNEAAATFGDMWRFSTLNNAWFDLAATSYGIYLGFPSGSQENPFWGPYQYATDGWQAICSPGPCHT